MKKQKLYQYIIVCKIDDSNSGLVYDPKSKKYFIVEEEAKQSCLYPSGVVDNQSFFFNKENIEKVWFEGYIDESEKEAQVLFEKK